MGIQLDGRNIPQIYLGKDKLFDVTDVPERPMPEIVKDNLILHYDFSQGDNNAEDRGVIKDLSGNGNDGVLHNFDYSEGSGYVENGLRFDGIDDYVEFDEIVLIPGGDFTIEAVVSDVQFEYGSFTYIINTGATVTRGLRISSSSIYLQTRENYATFFSGSPIPNHIAYTYNEEKVMVRLNGLTDRTITTVPQESSFIIKQLSTSLASEFRYQGVIHSIRIYKRDLSEQELTYNYNIDSRKYFGRTPPPKQYLPTGLKTGEKDISLIMRGDRAVYPNTVQDGLRLWYDFRSMAHDPFKETVARDLSGNHNHGNLNGFKFDGTDGYMNKGLMFNGEGSEVNFPKITFAADADWTVEIVLDKSTGITLNGRLLGDKVNNSHIRFYIDERYSSERYGRIYYMNNAHGSAYINMNENSPDFVHMIISKKDGVVSASSGDNPNVIHTRIVEHEQNFDNLGFATRFSASLDWSFKGLIHSVRVYDRALTQREVTQNHIIDKARYGL